MPMNRDQANDLLDRLRQVDSWRPVAKHSRAPAWFNQLWTQVAVAVGDDPVEYLDGELRSADGDPRGELVIFTHTRLVHARLGAGGKADVWTTSRRYLQRVEVDGGTPFSAAAGLDWPGPVRIRAVYPGGVVLRLPASKLDHQHWEQFHQFVASLLADLGGGAAQLAHREEQHHRAGWAW